MANKVVDLIDGSDLTFEPKDWCAIYLNQKIPLTELSLQVLQRIQSVHPNFVSNLELRTDVWHDPYIDENVPQQHISKLNEILPEFGLYIHGLRKRGYRLARVVPGHNQHKTSYRASRSQASIRALSDWRDANWMIAKATNSLVIIDSYFGHSGEIEPLIKEALKDEATRLKISIYLASPHKDFGAQRFKEKERPKEKRLSYKQVLDSNSINLLNVYREKYQHTYDSDVSEIIGHFTKDRVELLIYIYPIMPATRVYIVDDMYYIFGCFPLLAHNPGHPCFWAKNDGNLKGADAVAVNQLAQQVEIIKSISDQVWPLSSDEIGAPARKTRKRRQGASVSLKTTTASQKRAMLTHTR